MVRRMKTLCLVYVAPCLLFGLAAVYWTTTKTCDCSSVCRVLYNVEEGRHDTILPQKNNSEWLQLSSKAPIGTSPPTMQWEEVDKHTLLLSEHPDINVRGKFQQTRISQLCNKYRFTREQYFPSDSDQQQQFRRHLIFDDTRKAIYCFVPKVGCTNMKRLMLYMSGLLPMETVDWEWVEDSIYIEPALQHASFLNTTLTQWDRVQRVRTYYKFMIVRNPFERIVSGFRNKIEPPLRREDASPTGFPQGIKWGILSRFRRSELLYWMRTANSPESTINVTFPEFVRYLVESTKLEVNDHFIPSMQICHPCLIKYNFYGNFRNISHDVHALIKQFKTDPRFFRDESLHSSSEQTSNLLSHYYNQLSYRDKLGLFAAWYDELAFYYALYPSERNSHRELLGIDLPVL